MRLGVDRQSTDMGRCLNGDTRMTCTRLAICESEWWRLPPWKQLRVNVTLASLIGFERRLHSRTHASSVRATVKVAMKKEQRRERDADPHPNRRREHAMGEKSSRLTPYCN